MSATMSKRRYQISVLESGHSGIFLYEFCLSTLLEDESEMAYSIQERTDDLLDLKKGESMYFQPVRDLKESKGIILRIA